MTDKMWEDDRRYGMRGRLLLLIGASFVLWEVSRGQALACRIVRLGDGWKERGRVTGIGICCGVGWVGDKKEDGLANSGCGAIIYEQRCSSKIN
jgi:hypothetical protein